MTIADEERARVAVISIHTPVRGVTMRERAA